MTTKTKVLLVCPWCGEDLNEDELKYPYDIGGDVVCCNCESSWFWNHSFECCICTEQTLDSEESDLLVMFDDEFGEPGLYKILARPFFHVSHLGGAKLMEGTLKRIGPVPNGAFHDDAPCGSVCEKCKEGRLGKCRAIPRVT